MSNKIIACIIQGDSRSNTLEIIKDLSTKFDFVIWSTWDGTKVEIDLPNLYVIYNKIPELSGYGNRNLQRISMCSGIEKARRLNCTHILKWRTDLLSFKLTSDLLYKIYEQNIINSPINDVIISTSWRNLSVTPDWFSSFPDMFMFSSINMMEMMWSSDEFNYKYNFNFPKDLLKELKVKITDENEFKIDNKYYSISYFYDTHIELYSWFKYRLSCKLNYSLNHADILNQFFVLINPYDFEIMWFKNSPKTEFRPLMNSFQFNWWTTKNWKQKNLPKTEFIGWNKRKITKYQTLKNILNCKFQVIMQNYFYYKNHWTIKK